MKSQDFDALKSRSGEPLVARTEYQYYTSNDFLSYPGVYQRLLTPNA